MSAWQGPVNLGHKGCCQGHSDQLQEGQEEPQDDVDPGRARLNQLVPHHALQDLDAAVQPDLLLQLLGHAELDLAVVRDAGSLLVLDETSAALLSLGLQATDSVNRRGVAARVRHVPEGPIHLESRHETHALQKEL